MTFNKPLVHPHQSKFTKKSGLILNLQIIKEWKWKFFFLTI